MPSLPTLTSSDKPSTSDTSIDKESLTKNVSSAMDDVKESDGSSAAAETKAGIAQTASEVEKAANKLYEENIEDEVGRLNLKPRENEAREHAELRDEKMETILCSILAAIMAAVTTTSYHTSRMERDSFKSDGHALVAA